MVPDYLMLYCAGLHEAISRPKVLLSPKRRFDNLSTQKLPHFHPQFLNFRIPAPIDQYGG